MFHEVVRPGTLSQALTLQLLIGNAVEVLRLLQAGVTIDPREFEALRGAANSLRSGGASEASLTSSALSDSSAEMVAAARTALAPDTMHTLRDGLKVLAGALSHVADTRALDGLALPAEDLVKQLSDIRAALAARATVSTDETRTLLTA